MAIILMLNLKGGVAKTTNSVAIAEALAEQGDRVCVIDADHQCMAGELLIGEARMNQVERDRNTLHDLLSHMLKDDFEKENVAPYVIRDRVSNIGEGYENLHLIPCSARIEDFQTNRAKAHQGFLSTDDFQNMWRRSEARLRSYLVQNYDFVIVDCPPSIALQVRQALRIADGYVLPCIPDVLSVRGSIALKKRLETLGFSRVIPIGTLWSLYRSAVETHRSTIEGTLKKKAAYKDLPPPFRTIIPNAAAIAGATEPNRKYGSYSEKYQPKFAKLYRTLAMEIRQRSKGL